MHTNSHHPLQIHRTLINSPSARALVVLIFSFSQLINTLIYLRIYLRHHGRSQHACATERPSFVLHSTALAPPRRITAAIFHTHACVRVWLHARAHPMPACLPASRVVSSTRLPLSPSLSGSGSRFDSVSVPRDLRAFNRR